MSGRPGPDFNVAGWAMYTEGEAPECLVGVPLVMRRRQRSDSCGRSAHADTVSALDVTATVRPYGRSELAHWAG